ncbi:MAG: H4MPT-linked C1 transfer pathway protein [Methanobrevibacter sp.]|jgi:probable H4MPT-linked C1 transfer pathway protein|nr:H4MPT-linked C1 transfer pathway protein [Candidatus Methanovirga basalitermitum]
MKIAGFDIGGANTDLAVIDFSENGKIENISVNFEYLPMWSDNHRLGNVLLNLIKENNDLDDIDGVGISMTGELVDAYTKKEEGVLDISKKVIATFNIPVGFVGLDKFLTYNEVLINPSKIAAANWIATSAIISEIDENCIFIDTGSTTTDIIPIKNGKECSKGRSDFERLSTGELVYTGILRTNLSSFLRKVELNGKEYTVASELFATTADIYNVLGKIYKEDYSCSTSDGAGKSKMESMIRISRVLCGDMDILSKEDILAISKFTHEKQTEQIAEGLKKVSKRENIDKVVTTGLGGEILGKEATKLLNLHHISMSDFYTKEESVVAPAIGTAVLMYKHLTNY